MKTTISIEIDMDSLSSLTDMALAGLWHVAQANPAPLEDRRAGEIAELIGREIISRFLANTPPELWARQGRHADWYALMVLKGQLPPPDATQPAKEVGHG